MHAVIFADGNIFHFLTSSVLTWVKLLFSALCFSQPSCKYATVAPNVVRMSLFFRMSSSSSWRQILWSFQSVVSSFFASRALFSQLYWGLIKKLWDISSDCWWNSISNVVSEEWSWFEVQRGLAGCIRVVHSLDTRCELCTFAFTPVHACWSCHEVHIPITYHEVV